MPEILRLTPSQRSRCNRLIKRLCANYDDGNCLLLDDGEPCVCRRPFPIRCCACISEMRFYLPKKNCMRTFSNSVLITAPSAERLLCQTPTGKNTAYRAAKRCTAGRKTRAPESAKRTIRNPQMPGLQGLSQAETRQERIIYQNPCFGFLIVRKTKMKGMYL